jgi:hypothetical protein
MPIPGPRAERSALQRKREPFYAVIRRQIDAVWGWNGNSAAAVVHFRYTAYRFSAALRMQLRNPCGSESSASSTSLPKCSRFILHPLKQITAVRLKLEQNQLVDVVGEIGVLVDRLKSA